MNTIKNIIHSYRGYLFLASLASQFFGIFNLISIASEGTPAVNDSNMCAVIDVYILCFIISFVVSYVIAELRSLTSCMLPASLQRKYATAFATIIFAIVTCLLFSMAIECVGLLLTAGSDQAACFAIGGYIRYISRETGGYSLFVALIALETFVATLINKRSIHLGVNMFLSGIFWICIVLLSLTDISTPLCIISWGIAIILIIASYQIYKRWQPANSGFLTI